MNVYFQTSRAPRSERYHNNYCILRKLTFHADETFHERFHGVCVQIVPRQVERHDAVCVRAQSLNSSRGENVGSRIGIYFPADTGVIRILK